MRSHRTDRFAGYGQDPSRNQTMTYEEKVRLYNEKRYLMPLPPLGTKNWTRAGLHQVHRSIRQMVPGGGIIASSPDTSTLDNFTPSLNQLQSVVNPSIAHTAATFWPEQIPNVQGVGIVFSADDEWKVR